MHMEEKRPLTSASDHTRESAPVNSQHLPSWPEHWLSAYEMPGWINHKLESSLLGEISTTSDMQMTSPLMAESEEELKNLLMTVKEESEKADLKLNIQKAKVTASGPITSWQIDGETVETMADFILGGSKTLQMVIAAMKLKAT